MSDDIMEENTGLWVRNANQAATIARLRDESDGQFRRIAELEAELADALPAVRAERRKTARAEARLAAVVALCDGPHDNCGGYREDALNETGCYVSPALRAVRAAATGETA